MNFEEAVSKFVESPCRLTTGVPSLSKRWNIDLDTLYAAKASAKDILKNKEQFGTEYNPADVAFNHYNNILNGEDVKKPLKVTLEEAKDKLSEAMTSESPNWKPKSKWQTASGEWRESFQYNEETIDNIDFENILNKVFSSTDIEKVELPVVNSGRYSMSVHLADQHIGAKVEHSLYSNYFDKHVYRDRMNAVQKEIGMKSLLYGGFDTICINFLGDTFDGQDGYTVKRTHELPQNMSNSEAFEVGLYTNKVFLERLFASGAAKNYKVYFVRESNHGGDMDLYLFQALKMWIETKYTNVTATIANRFIDHYKVGVHTFIYTHGKDNKDMKSGLPLNLDQKTEIFFNQYIDYYELKNNIHLVKADLHQNAFNESKLFTYRNVPSIFGSSKWIMSNFGLTKPACGYDIYNMETPEYIPGVISLK